MPTHRLRLLVLVPFALAILIASCGGDDDDAAPAAGVDYETALRTLVERTEEEIDAAGEAVEEAETTEEVLDAIADAFPTILEIIEDAVDDLEDLDPPAQFADDHAAFLAAVGEQVEVQRELIEAIEDGDVEAITELTPRIDEIQAELEAEISPEFRELIAAFLDDDE